MGLSVQEKKVTIDFQDGNCGGHLVFPIGTILTIFLSKRHPDAFYQVLSQLASSGEKVKNRFLKWGKI